MDFKRQNHTQPDGGINFEFLQKSLKIRPWQLVTWPYWLAQGALNMAFRGESIRRNCQADGFNKKQVLQNTVCVIVSALF
jgi:hypothetical protein